MEKKLPRVAIVGIGCTAKPGHHHPIKTWKDLAADAVYEALDDAHMKARELDGCCCAYHGEGVSEQGGLGAAMSDALGIAPASVFSVVGNCCGGTIGIVTAYNLIASGMYKRVAVVGGDKEGDNLNYGQVINVSYDTEYDYMFGFRHRDGGVLANSYFKRFGYSKEEVQACNAAMAHQVHKFARMNPKASLYGTPCPSRESLVGPTALFTMMGEGSGCVIMVPEEDAYKYSDKPIWIEGLAYSNTSHYVGHRLNEEPMGPEFPDWIDREDSRALSITGMVATKKAYEMAGITPDQIDVAQVYDLGHAALLLAESLGLCPLGEAARCFFKGEFDLGGRCPVDTDGGNIARGHSSGADGIFQVVENVIQLRGEAGQRQVKDAKLAASCNVGSVQAHVTTIVLANDRFHNESAQ